MLIKKPSDCSDANTDRDERCGELGRQSERSALDHLQQHPEQEPQPKREQLSAPAAVHTGDHLLAVHVQVESLTFAQKRRTTKAFAGQWTQSSGRTTGQRQLVQPALLVARL